MPSESFFALIWKNIYPCLIQLAIENVKINNRGIGTQRTSENNSYFDDKFLIILHSGERDWELSKAKGRQSVGLFEIKLEQNT